MAKAQTHSRFKRTGLSALAGLAMCLQSPMVLSQTLTEVQSTEPVVGGAQGQPLPFEVRARVNYDTYILGPGDGMQIELLDLPELSGNYSIGPDGTLYLPRYVPSTWKG